MQLSVHLDTRELEERMLGAAAEILRGLRNAVDRTARAARKGALAAASKDIGGTLAEAKKNQPVVRGSTQRNLAATWRVVPIFVNATSISNISISRTGGLKMSTYRFTGGKSADLFAPKAFEMNVGGRRFAMLRTKRGLGTHRGGLRAVSAEMTRTSMGQGDGYAAIEWKKTATELLASSASAAVQAALNGARASSNAGSD